VVIGESVFETGLGDKSRCKDWTEDCVEIEREGYALRCWLYDPAKGVCPFVGN